MPKPFRLNPRQAAQQKKDLDRKDQIVLAAQKAMDAVLKAAVEKVYAHYLKTGRYKEPDLSKMFEVSETFYKHVIGAAVSSAKAQVKPKKRLAAAPPAGNLPTGPEQLDDVLKNRRYYQRIMRRSRALTGRAKDLYLRNLKDQFKKILPTLEAGDLSPRQVKQKLAEAWRAPAARVQTIFQTESTRYFAQSQIQYFKDTPDVIGFLFDSIRDHSRTPICQSRHGLIFRPGTKLLDTNAPPCHYGCRSALVPLVNDEENRKMLADPQRDPSKHVLVPLPPGWKS